VPPLTPSTSSRWVGRARAAAGEPASKLHRTVGACA
jgi:hypothetical protein